MVFNEYRAKPSARETQAIRTDPRYTGHRIQISQKPQTTDWKHRTRKGGFILGLTFGQIRPRGSGELSFF